MRFDGLCSGCLTDGRRRRGVRATKRMPGRQRVVKIECTMTIGEIKQEKAQSFTQTAEPMRGGTQLNPRFLLLLLATETAVGGD